MKAVIRKNDFHEVHVKVSELKEYLLKHEGTKHYLAMLIDELRTEQILHDIIY